MTDPDAYLWTGEGPVDDPFVAELEARLAPLDDSEQLLAGLELEDLAARALDGCDSDGRELDALAEQISLAGAPLTGEAASVADKVVQLRPLEPEQPPLGPRAGPWTWLAAAVAVLGLSVAVLASERRAQLSAAAHVGGPRSAPRVIVDAPPELHEHLRSACVSPPATVDEPAPGCEPDALYPGLSRCALGLAPGSSARLELTIHDGVEGVETIEADAATQACVAEAVDGLALGLGEPQRVRIELHAFASD